MSCVLPYTNIEARTDGTISVCCIMQDHAKKPDGTSYNLAKGDTITDVLNSKWLANYRRQFAKGAKPKACSNCWHEENAGLQSKRLRENKFWEKHGTDTLLSLDLKLGNICNSKCRICTSFASSQWVPEEVKIDPEKAPLYKNRNKLGQWPETNEDFWTDIDNHLPSVKKLEFYGGEPLLIDRHLEILEKCIEIGVAKDIQVTYNTNGSIPLSDKFINLWKNFKHIEIFFSIDDVYNRFNYIRHPGDFFKVIENLQQYKNLELDRTKGSYAVSVFQTISILNICDIMELTNYIHEYVDKKTNIHYNMVFTPMHMSPKALPKKAKEYILDRFNHAPTYVEPILEFIRNEDYPEEAIKTFVNLTKHSDMYRKESFVDTFPTLYSLIKEYWDEQ